MEKLDRAQRLWRDENMIFHSRRQFIVRSLSLTLLLSVAMTVSAREALFYVGTFTGSAAKPTGSKGIYVSRLDLETGKLSPLEVAGEASNPAFLALAPDRKHLYAVDEVGSTDGKPVGGVNAFAVDAATHKLTWLNHASSGGPGPCHLAVDPAGKLVVVANYGGGSIAALPIQRDGKLSEAATFIQHEGKSVDPKRQDKAYAHCATFSRDGKLLFVNDLGLDRLMIYDVDAARGALTVHEPAFCSIKPGSGPRHFVLHPDKKHAYVISEMGSSITALDYDAAHGSFSEIQNISTLPGDFTGSSTCAEIAMHPSGHFVYGSNRGHDSIAVFRVEAKTGKLTFVETDSTRGKTPRSFAVDPTGHWVIAANQDSNSLAVFSIDQKTGKLTPVGDTVALPAPVCVLF